MGTLDKVHKLLRHIRNVQDGCIHLGEKLIEKGEEKLGRTLIRNGLQHDSSKFTGIEWDYLDCKDSPIMLALAIKTHQGNNRHHPEYHSDIHDMPDVDIAEMVADWRARAGEFGTDLRVWVTTNATIKFQFKMTDPVGRKIKKYMNLILDKPFK